MRDALEKTLNTEMEGEDVELNSLEGEMRINIFKPINNKTVKKKFRSVVNKTRSMLNVLRRSRTYQNMPSTRQMNQPRVRRGSRRGSRINNLLIVSYGLYQFLNHNRLETSHLEPQSLPQESIFQAQPNPGRTG